LETSGALQEKAKSECNQEERSNSVASKLWIHWQTNLKSLANGKLAEYFDYSAMRSIGFS